MKNLRLIKQFEGRIIALYFLGCSMKGKGKKSTTILDRYILLILTPLPMRDAPFVNYMLMFQIPNLPTSNLLDCISVKYHPGARITILLFHSANFTFSPFHLTR